MELRTRITSVASYLTSLPSPFVPRVSYQHSTQSDPFKVQVRSCHSAPNLPNTPILLKVKAQVLTRPCMALHGLAPLLPLWPQLFSTLPCPLSFSHTGSLLFLNIPNMLPLPTVPFSQICPYLTHYLLQIFAQYHLFNEAYPGQLIENALYICILPKTPNSPYPFYISYHLSFYRNNLFIMFIIYLPPRRQIHVSFVHWFLA